MNKSGPKLPVRFQINYLLLTRFQKIFSPVLLFQYTFRFCHAQLRCNSQGYQYHSRHQWRIKNTKWILSLMIIILIKVCNRLHQNNNKQTVVDIANISQIDCLNICRIFDLSPSPNSLENSGKKTWVKSLGTNIRILTMERTEEYIPASELLKYTPIIKTER